jgi:hypothetical protein
MGMFDTLIVEYPLPDAGAAVVKDWQTKSFDWPSLQNYKITAAGQLLRERYHYNARSKESKAGTPRLVGRKQAHEGWETVPFSGVLNFYGDQYSEELLAFSHMPKTLGKDLLHPEPAEWFEYNAKFTDGQIVSIERVPIIPSDCRE